MANEKTGTKGASAQTSNVASKGAGVPTKDYSGTTDEQAKTAGDNAANEAVGLPATPERVIPQAVSTSAPLTPFKVQKATELPANFGEKTSTGTGAIGLADSLRALKEKGDHFFVPKKANGKGGFKRDNSRFATLRKNAKEWGIPIWFDTYNETTDVVYYDHTRASEDKRKQPKAETPAAK